MATRRRDAVRAGDDARATRFAREGRGGDCGPVRSSLGDAMSFSFGTPAAQSAPATPATTPAPAQSAPATTPALAVPAPATGATKVSPLPATRSLFYALDERLVDETLDASTASALEGALDHVTRLCETYTPPSAASASALRSGSIEYGGSTLKMSATTASVAEACAKRLRLDETQAYVLLRRTLKECDMPRPTEATEEVVREVMRFYFRERLGTIKCAHTLLVRSASTSASTAKDGDEWESTVQKMIDRGLEDNLYRAIERHMSGASATGPEGANASDAAAWAGQALEETVALLEVLFLLYYNKLKCSPDRFLRLAKIFEKGALRRAPSASIELELHVPQSQVNAFTEDIRALCNVILIAAMDLEGLIDRFSGKSLKSHGFLDANVIKSVTEMFEKWQSDAAHGPTLLGWSTFLTLLPADAEFMPGSFSIDAMTQKANECGIGALSKLLDAEQLRGQDTTVTLHKSVLKNMFATILAAYDMLPVHRLPAFELNQILNVLEKLLADQPILCEQFWGGAREDGQETPLFALLEGCRERFPYDSVPLLRVIAALSEGHRAAECALAYIAQLPTVALPVPSRDILQRGIKPNDGAEMDASSGMVRGSVTALHRLTSPYISGGFIEAGMSGLAMNLGAQTTPLIIWAAPADGLHLCLTRLSILTNAGLHGKLKATEMNELDAITLFLSKVLVHAPSFARPMLACDITESVPKGSPTDILTGLSLALHVCSKSLLTEDNVRRTATIVRALTPLAAAEPSRTIAEVLEAPILSGTPGTGVPGLIHAIRDSESRLGEYPLSLAVLGLVETLIRHGGLGTRLEALVDHVMQEVAVRHVQWRYKHRADKWVVHAAVQRIVYEIFVPRLGDFAMQLRNKVLAYFVNDKAISFGSFAPLVYDAHALRKLHEEGGTPRAEEVTALEQAIAVSLKSLPLIVFHAGNRFGGEIEKMFLVETNNRGAPFASSIASYAAYPYAAACFPLALPALIPLCAVATNTPMAATLDKNDRAEILTSLQRMFKHADVETDAIADAADLLSAGIANQPEWVDTLLVPEEEPVDALSTPAPALPSAATNAIAAAPASDTALVTAPTTPTPAAQTPVASEQKKTKSADGALALIWNILEDPAKICAASPRCLRAIARTLDMLWRRRPLLDHSVETLKVRDGELWKRLLACADVPKQMDAGDSTSLAYGLSTMSSVLSIFAVEMDISRAGDESSNATFTSLVKEWCASSRISDWLDTCLLKDGCSRIRRQTQHAAQTFVLRCVATLEREEMSAKRAPLMADATLQHVCGQIRDALLSHPAGKDLRANGASNVAILEAVAQESANSSPNSVTSTDPVHKLLAAAREIHVESAVFAPAPLGVSGIAEYGESYLYDSRWIRVANGCSETVSDEQWGAPEGMLAGSARVVSGQLAETCLVSSVADAQASAVCSLTSFITAAAGSELPKMHSGVFTTNDAQKNHTSLLDGFSRDARKKLVMDAAAKFAATIDADTSSSATYVSPLALEIANLLAVSTQLWSVSVSKASPQTPAEADFEVVQRVIGIVSSVLASRSTSSGSPVREASSLVNPLLTTLLFAIRAWRAGAHSSKTVQPSYELGQSALPLIPLVCHAAATVMQDTPKATSSMALMLLEDIARDLLPTSALLQVLSAHKILPPLKPATGDDDVDSVTIAALNTCLSLSQSEQGAEILLASDTVRQLAVLCVESSNAKTATDHDIYCSALRVTAMLAGSPLAVRDIEVGSDLVHFCTVLETRMLAALLPKEITVASLREAEVTAFFFGRLASTFGAQWQVASPEGQMRCRTACGAFLRWFAAPQVVSGMKCPRKTVADAELATKPPATRARQAWFQATARGDSMREPTSPLIGAAPRGSPIADASTRAGNAYSEAIAIAMYRTAREACAFLASFPRAVDAATLGFDVTASLRDQCDALACDDIGTNAADPSNTTETALVDALRALKTAAETVERLEAAAGSTASPPTAAASASDLTPAPRSPRSPFASTHHH